MVSETRVVHVNDNVDAAHANLRDWQAVKEEARVSGRDMATVLAEYTRQHSHRRSSEA